MSVGSEAKRRRVQAQVPHGPRPARRCASRTRSTGRSAPCSRTGTSPVRDVSSHVARRIRQADPCARRRTRPTKRSCAWTSIRASARCLDGIYSDHISVTQRANLPGGCPQAIRALTAYERRCATSMAAKAPSAIYLLDTNATIDIGEKYYPTRTVGRCLGPARAGARFQSLPHSRKYRRATAPERSLARSRHRRAIAVCHRPNQRRPCSACSRDYGGHREGAIIRKLSEVDRLVMSCGEGAQLPIVTGDTHDFITRVDTVTARHDPSGSGSFQRGWLDGLWSVNPVAAGGLFSFRRAAGSDLPRPP